MSWQRIPTVEQIYNEFHKQYWFALNGVYPKTMKNFEPILNDKVKMEYLLRFQNLLKRNSNLIDWKLYIKANAETLKHRFTLKVLGTLGATKIYKSYLLAKNKNINTETVIYDEIISSLQFLNLYFSENKLNFETYLLENNTALPIALQHIYSGTVSLYFYAVFSDRMLNSLFRYYLDDAFYELFEMDKISFINNIILPKRLEILKFNKTLTLAKKIEQKFLVNNNI